VPDTDGRYQFGLTIKPGAEYNVEKTVFEQTDESKKSTFVSLHLKQRFWKDNPNALNGITALCQYAVVGPDGTIIREQRLPCRMQYGTTKVNTWRVW
jgi:hypothetical protein